MAGRFPLLTDNHVRQPIIGALRKAGWDVARVLDVFGERNDDDELLAWASKEGRVFVTSDKGIHAIARKWLDEGDPFGCSTGGLSATAR